MIAPFTTLKKSTVSAKAGSFQVSDLMFDPDRHTVDYAVLSGGGWIAHTDVLLHGTRLRAFEPSELVWPAQMGEADLAEAPRIGSDNRVDLTNLPPVIVGPFGMTYSPMLLAAKLFGYPVNKQRAARDAEERLERMSDWIGAVVFNAEGPIARIVNFNIDTETMKVVEVKIAIDAEMHALPITSLRNFVTGDGYAVTDLTTDDIQQGFTAVEPGPHVPVPPRRSWVQHAAA
jgi:hypothetical protein